MNSNNSRRIRRSQLGLFRSGRRGDWSLNRGRHFPPCLHNQLDHEVSQNDGKCSLTLTVASLRFLSSDFFDDILSRSVEKARSMEVEEMAEIMQMVQNAYEKYQQLQ